MALQSADSAHGGPVSYLRWVDSVECTKSNTTPLVSANIPKPGTGMDDWFDAERQAKIDRVAYLVTCGGMLLGAGMAAFACFTIVQKLWTVVISFQSYPKIIMLLIHQHIIQPMLGY